MGVIMLAVRLNPDIEQRINHLAKTTGRSKSYYVKKAIERYLEDEEDLYIALYRLEHPAKTIPLEKVIEEYERT